jgi:molybdate transport system substrate-binding protein
MNSVLRLLSAGAAQGIAIALTPKFEADTGTEVNASFAPVGVLRDKLLAGEAPDVIVSTPSMLEEFVRSGRIDGATIVPLGRVHTGVAVRSGEPAPAIDDPDRLRAAFAAAPRIHVPDPERATAGIHLVKVLHKLGLYEMLGPRLASHANGAAAMAALAAAHERGALGCTQATEIVFTPGVSLVGVLPAPFDLATAYAAAVSNSARDPELALRFVTSLAGREAASLRRRSGFEE